jgi:hypothetical protein
MSPSRWQPGGGSRGPEPRRVTVGGGRVHARGGWPWPALRLAETPPVYQERIMRALRLGHWQAWATEHWQADAGPRPGHGCRACGARWLGSEGSLVD